MRLFAITAALAAGLSTPALATPTSILLTPGAAAARVAKLEKGQRCALTRKVKTATKNGGKGKRGRLAKGASLTVDKPGRWWTAVTANETSLFVPTKALRSACDPIQAQPAAGRPESGSAESGSAESGSAESGSAESGSAGPGSAGPDTPTRAKSVPTVADPAPAPMADPAPSNEAARARTEQAVAQEQILSEVTAPAAPVAPVATAGTPAPVSAKGMDALLRRLSDSVAAALRQLPGDDRDQAFAVLPFESVGQRAEEARLGLVVSDRVLTNLVRDHRLAIAERARLKDALDEISLSQLGVVAPSEADALGNYLGASALVVGQVSEVGTSFRVTARVVSVQTGQVLATTAVDVPGEELTALSVDAVVLKSRSDALFRSLAIPGWGQAYNGEPAKAALVGGTFLAGVVTTATLGTFAVMRLSEYNATPGSQDAIIQEFGSLDAYTAHVEQTRADYGRFATGTAIAAGVTGLVWLLGGTDAYLSGVDAESLDDGAR